MKKAVCVDTRTAKAVAFLIGCARYANAAAYYNELKGTDHRWYEVEGEAIGKAYAIALGDMEPPPDVKFGKVLG